MIFRSLPLLLRVGDKCQIQMSFNSCEENGRKVSKMGVGWGGVVNSINVIEGGAISQTKNLSEVFMEGWALLFSSWCLG